MPDCHNKTLRQKCEIGCRFIAASEILSDGLNMPDREFIAGRGEIIAAKRLALAERKAKTPIEAVRALASMQKRPLPVLNTVTNDSRVILLGQIKYSPSPDGLVGE